MDKLSGSLRLVGETAIAIKHHILKSDPREELLSQGLSGNQALLGEKRSVVLGAWQCL